MKKLWLIGALFVSAVATAAYAAQQDFTLTNNTGHVIMTLNVSPSDSDDWGPDILGRDVLGDDESAEVSFDRDEDQCVWDIRVTYDDGDTNDERGINLCETTDVVFTP